MPVPRGALKVAAAALKDFALDESTAWSILTTWNRGNYPPLSDEELTTVLKGAGKYGKHEPGRLARQLSRPTADTASFAFKALSAPVAAR